VEDLIDSTTRHLLCHVSSAQAPWAEAIAADVGYLLAVAYMHSIITSIGKLPHLDVSVLLCPAGAAQPPAASAVSAAARKLLRGIVMGHETITEWDEPPGDTN
jgi:hypothetical protein